MKKIISKQKIFFQLLKRFTMNHISKLVAVFISLVLVACAGTTDPRRIPEPLKNFQQQVEIKKNWQINIGSGGGYFLQPALGENSIYAAAANGDLSKIDQQTGKLLWRMPLAKKLSAGVASHNQLIVIVTQRGDVLAINDEGASGKLKWATNISGEVLSSPLVSHNMVVVKTTDGRVIAMNSNDGRILWRFRSPVTSLNLRTVSDLQFVNEDLILVGFTGGNVVILNSKDGELIWQTAISYPRGVTEVERINDVTGQPVIVGSILCTATFQGRIGCIDSQSKQIIWDKPFSSYSGLAANSDLLVAGDEWSKITAFHVQDGRQQWENNQLKSRQLSSPLLIGKAVVVGDYQGFLHFLSQSEGNLIARVETDGSPITVKPILAPDDLLIVQTQKGGLFTFSPN